MQPGTGRILAMAQYPTFNPNQPISYNATHNIAVTNVFAPGSTLKPLTVAAALEKGGQTPMSTYTVPDQIVVHGFTFHDAEPHATARYTVAGILADSLNDGMVQLVQKVTRPAAVRLPAELRPRLPVRAGPAGREPRTAGQARHQGLLERRALRLFVRPGHRRDGHPDGQRLRHHRQRRRPGPALDRGRDHQRRGQVHARARGGPPPGHPGRDG